MKPHKADEVPPAVVAEALARGSRPDYRRWEAMVHAAGCCAQPVRLAGRVLSIDPRSGELSVVYSSSAEADRVLFKACESRRATRCPACAALYRGDAKALLRLGVDTDRGDATGSSPVVFVTLTAPSFGAVHRVLEPTGACHERGRATCAHGRSQTCRVVHDRGDRVVGAPICDECYDWVGAVMFNARANELWRRTIIATSRSLAGAAGLRVREFAEHYRLAFAKVVEFQARGVVHLHALARLDHDEDAPQRLRGQDLANAFAVAAARVSAPNPIDLEARIRWGPQAQIEVIPKRRRRAAAAYVAKYATKSVDNDGLLDRRLSGPETLDRLDLPSQIASMAATAWTLGGLSELQSLNLRAWAHSLGYRGHWLTKSATWSTTFSELRAVRHRWRMARLGISPEEAARRFGEWEYKGVGYQSAGDAWLAASANAAAKRMRRTRWEEN